MTSITTPAAWNVRGENVRIPEGERRNPTAFLDLWIGDAWGITVGVQQLKKSGLIMRLPIAPDGSEGIRPCPDLLAAMRQAAVQAVHADPVALAHLTQPHPEKRRKVGGKRPKPEAA